ncbi:hypothetical protein ACIRD8_10225 [Streptomyces sp. NPDC102451]|uniref:hypothetical protein n=1 Tax=Streptomyces sp. NPDC102451 TaxID=3366177 RepID=UPI003813F617
MMRSVRGLALLLICLSPVGCAGEVISTSSEGRSGMDMQEAADRADSILDSALNEIQPKVNWAHGITTTGSCDVSRRRAVMTSISPERRGSFLGLMDRHWRKSGYRIKAVNNSAELPAIYAQTDEGFGVSLRFGGQGQAFFQVDSPCVDKSEVAESTTPPNGPAYEGVYPLPRPNIRSPFWSAGAP